MYVSGRTLLATVLAASSLSCLAAVQAKVAIDTSQETVADAFMVTLKVPNMV